MQKFVNFVGIVGITVAIITFIIGIIRMKERSSENILTLFVNGFLVIIVAFVPQGLPATVLSLLTIVGKQLAANNIFVKRLDVIETLGSISLICSDKTGTLTKNQMSVQDVWSQNNY
jgi:sodium/potassium-transporting ATPase subunit alpha